MRRRASGRRAAAPSRKSPAASADQPLLQPDLVLRQRAARARHAGAQALLVGRRQRRDLRAATSPSSIEISPAFCFDGGFGVHLGHARRHRSTSRSCARKRGNSSSRLPRFFSRSAAGRELARDQVVDRVAGEARIDERIPAPVLQRLDLPALGTRVRACSSSASTWLGRDSCAAIDGVERRQVASRRMCSCACQPAALTSSSRSSKR